MSPITKLLKIQVDYWKQVEIISLHTKAHSLICFQENMSFDDMKVFAVDKEKDYWQHQTKVLLPGAGASV